MTFKGYLYINIHEWQITTNLNNDLTKIGIERGQNEENTGRKAQINTKKINWQVSTTIDVYLNQKRINVWEHISNDLAINKFQI